ncbi:hypothetical protein GCM10017691_46760 [Pseudonocardia petroleophila]|uniref:RiboL-PSP-HEPN domain-containing protein n=1 Tax=Pseudonocardia petroleophila TaxID=37331 RepID=A0A7G7MQR0_9PSEU|nr:hypothetical protein [Pseudonocardia petroleophila]QNG55121.1 hypothetical protein H6H00_15400 [Pseudonocardia petroleophila]
MTGTVSATFDRAREALEREGRRLDSITAAAVGVTSFDHDGFNAISRALSFVVMGGVLEDWSREISSAISADVDNLGLQRRHLPITVIAAMEASTFRQCGNDNVSGLMARARVISSATLHASDARPVLQFGDLFSLADGSTISDKHFEALWMVLGLEGEWRNHPNDSLLLREIRDKRNDVAHWKEDPVEIGRKKRASDLRAMVDRLIRLLDHIELSLLYWLDGARMTAGPAATSASP